MFVHVSPGSDILKSGSGREISFQVTWNSGRSAWEPIHHRYSPSKIITFVNPLDIECGYGP